MTTYALYTGWPADSVGVHKYRKSNLVMIGILCVSILSAAAMVVLLRVFGNSQAKHSSASSTNEGEGAYIDGAARREEQQRGLGRMLWFK
jgi:hypothetical protein